MAEAALHPELLTIAEFLANYPDGDLRYELIDGVIVAMNPPVAAHALLVSSLVMALSRRLPPHCRVYTGGGTRLADDEHTYRIPDLAVSCTPSRGGWVEEPRLIVEVLSPSTQRADSTVKHAFFRSLPSVGESLLVRSDRRHVEHWRREGEHWTVRALIGTAAITTSLLPEAVPLEEIYAALEFDPEPLA